MLFQTSWRECILILAQKADFSEEMMDTGMSIYTNDRKQITKVKNKENPEVPANGDRTSALDSELG